MEETARYETIRLAAVAPVARITLARPPLNILSIAMLEELADAVESLGGREDVRVVVLHAEGRAFSAGVDVEDHVDDKVRPMIAAFHGLFLLSACRIGSNASLRRIGATRNKSSPRSDGRPAASMTS